MVDTPRRRGPGKPKKPAQRGRPKVNKRRQRMNSPFIKAGVRDVNREIEENYKEITGLDKLWDTYTKINSADAEHVFDTYKGRCVFCDKRVSYLGRMSIYAARLMFYVPLNVGGEARVDNLVLVCAQCKHDYKSTRSFREDMESIDSFADTCEALFQAVKDGADEETRNRIKNRLNVRLSDIATCMRYKFKSDWEPTHLEMITEKDNTIGERLEDMAEGEDVKDAITNDAKQIIKTKQYKIMRVPEDE